MQTIIFTDLDGTLLDYHTYSFEKALPALELIRRKGIPLVVCSSKTRKEIEYYRDKIGNRHPFVTENGGGIIIPKNYFSFDLSGLSCPADKGGDCGIIALGAPYADLRRAILRLREEGLAVRGFGDMTAEELSVLAGMSVEEALLAKERDFDEPFLFSGNCDELQKLIASVRAKGFTITHGRFFHIHGDNDKGKAVSLLIELYRREFGDIVTVAIGDRKNDIPMLRQVDYPITVQTPDGYYDLHGAVPHLIKAEGIGPEGWNSAIRDIISKVVDF